MPTSNIATNEGQITFKKVQGHKHDGITSSLIDATKYSMFDFIATENTKDAKRSATQQNNKKVLKTFIVSTIEERILNPAGIRIQANAITAREIVSGTVTADKLVSNIILVNNTIRSSNYTNTSVSHTGWIISNTGNAEFNDVTIRGNIIAGEGFYNAANTALFANSGGYFSLKDKLTWNGNTLTVRGTLQLSDGTSAQSVNANSGSIGGILIGGSSIRSTDYDANPTTAGFVINSDGTATFNEMIVRGTIYAGDGYIGGIDINSTELQSNYYVAGSAGFRISSNGNAEFNNVTVRGNLRFADNSIPGTFDNGDAITAGSIGGVNISSTTIYAGVGNWANANTPFYLDVNGYFSLEDKLYWNPATNGLTISGSITASTISGSTLTTNDGSNGIEITSDGYIRGTGGSGVRIKNSDSTTGGTQLFKDLIISNTIRSDLFNVSNRFSARDIGVSITPTDNNTPLELERNYASGANFIRFYNRSNNTYPGAIEYSGTNSINYKTTSDKRLKENIEEISNASLIVKKLNPVMFNFISDGPSLKMHGFLAQDMYEEYPYPVSVGSDDVQEKSWGIDYGKITPLLTASLKEVLDKIDSLESRLQTLEGV